MRNLESRSFVTVDGLCFVSSKNSDRNRDRLHILPPENPMSLESYTAFVRGIINNPQLKKIFIRNEDHFEIVDPSQLIDIRYMEKREKRKKIYSLASNMHLSEEVVIEDAIPEEITIQNVPQVVFEPVPINLEH